MPIKQPLVLISVAFIVAIAFAFRGLTTHEHLAESSPPGQIREAFGWPMVFYSGNVKLDDDYPYKHWSDLHLGASDRRIHIAGLAFDLLLLIALLIGTVGTIQHVVDRLRPKISIGLLTGLVTFAAVEIKLRWHFLLPPNEIGADDVELIVAVYSRKIVYLAILVSCFYAPITIVNVICRRLGKKKTRNNAINTKSH